MAVGESTLYIYTKKDASSNAIERQNFNVQAVSWSGDATFIQPFTINLIAADFNTSGGTIYAVFKSNSNSEYSSAPACALPIIKTPLPTFNLSSSTSTIACNSSTPVQFTVTNVHNSPGTLTYNWSFNSTWQASGPVSNISSSITLIPLVYAPSSVSVTPIYNNVAQPTKTVSFTLAPFNPSTSLVGNTQACPGSSLQFSLENLATSHLVTWIISDPTKATLSNVNTGSVTVNAIAPGNVILTAAIRNSCNQLINLTKTILIGYPRITNNTIVGGNDHVFVNQTGSFSTGLADGATSYKWEIVQGSTNCGSSATKPKFMNGSTVSISSSPSAYVYWGDCPGWYILNCYAVNSCGQSSVGYRVVTVSARATGDPCARELVVSPNPIRLADSKIEISFKPAPGPIPCLEEKQLSLNNSEIKLFDINGRQVFSKVSKSDKFQISDLKDFKKGTYILNVTSSNGVKTDKVILIE